jgi:hypothetical protein
MTARVPAFLAFLLATGCASGAREDAAAPPNLALGRPVSAPAGFGDPRSVTDGRLLPEATAPAAEHSVPLPDVRASVAVDLGSLQPVGALLLQADAADVYFVELSADANAWYVAWRVEPVAGASGLWTRHTGVRPVGARFVRARATTARSAAVSELQVFAAEPAAWPAVDLTGREAHRPLWPGLTRERLNTLFGALAGVFLAVAAWSAATLRLPAQAAPRRGARRALLALAAASLLAWPNFLNFHYYGFVHTWEFFHYFMGAKYLPELGYSCLYTAAAAADAEDGIDLTGRLVRDLRDNRLVPTETDLQRAPACRERFSPERWADFQRDARFFRAAMGTESWFGVRQDHGFNGTPAWAVVGGMLARAGPASRPLLVAIAAVDILLVLATFAIMGRAFGLEAACIAAGFWGVNTLAPFGWTGGAFLRYDWLFWLVGGLAALRAGRPAAAGFALGYSTLLRVFPAAAVAGVLLKAAVEAASARSLRPLARHARLAAGVAAAAIVFAGGAALVAGPGIWGEFAANSVKHRATASSNLIGIEAALSYEHDGRLELMTDPLLLDRHAAWKERVAAAETRTRPSRWLAAALFVLLLAVATRGAPDWAAAVLGLGLVPMVFVLSSYYYSFLIAFAALFAVRAGAGVALAGLGWATTALFAFYPQPDARYAALSLAVVTFVIGMAGDFAWRSARGRQPWAEVHPT